MSKETEIVKRGWGFPVASKKAHYFNYEPRSLCGSWMFTGVLENDNHESVDNCKACMKKRAKLYPNET